jgi:hypothetical protein
MMTKTDPAIEAIRKVRREISHEFGNDPARLIAHYIELQRRVEAGKLIRGPEDEDGSEPKTKASAAERSSVLAVAERKRTQ